MEAEEFLSGGIFFITLDYPYILSRSSLKVNAVSLIFFIFHVIFDFILSNCLFHLCSFPRGKLYFAADF